MSKLKEKTVKLVYVSLMTRVVVDVDATDEEILEAARPKLLEKVNTELMENLEDIVDDIECPFDAEFDK